MYIKALGWTARIFMGDCSQWQYSVLVPTLVAPLVARNPRNRPDTRSQWLGLDFVEFRHCRFPQTRMPSTSSYSYPIHQRAGGFLGPSTGVLGARRSRGADGRTDAGEVRFASAVFRSGWALVRSKSAWGRSRVRRPSLARPARRRSGLGTVVCRRTGCFAPSRLACQGTAMMADHAAPPAPRRSCTSRRSAAR